MERFLPNELLNNISSIKNDRKLLYKIMLIQILFLLCMILIYIIFKLHLYKENMNVVKQDISTEKFIADTIDITNTTSNKGENEILVAYLDNYIPYIEQKNDNIEIENIVNDSEEITEDNTNLDIEENSNIETSSNFSTSSSNTQQNTSAINIDTNTYTASDGTKYSNIAKLNIPSLGINYNVLSTTSDALLKISLNKFWGPNPNEIGNFVIIGHNYKNKTHFGKLPQIQIGALVYLADVSRKTVTYKVYDTYTIDPNDVSCTSQLTNGAREVTLITCNNGGKTRFVAKAREI